MMRPEDQQAADEAFKKLIATMYPKGTVLKPHVETALRECFAAGYIFAKDSKRFELLLSTPGKWN